MCRYGIHPVKQHYACFECHKVFRHYQLHGAPAPRCPECRQPLEAMGFDFKAPKRNDILQWAKVRLLAAHGVRFLSCGCDGPGDRPATLRDTPDFLASRGEDPTLVREQAAYLRRTIKARLGRGHR